MATSGFTFGAAAPTASTSTTGLFSGFSFGAKSTASSGTTATPSFGFSLTSTGANRPGTGGTFGGFSFGAKTSVPTATAAPLGTGPQSTISGTGTFGSSSFGAPGSKTTSQLTTSTTSGGLSTGLSLFGAKTTASTTTSTGLQLGLGSALTSTGGTGLSLGGGLSGALGASATTSSTASVTIQKAPENPKDSQVPNELVNIVQELEKHIKEQRARKDEITRFSSKAIHKIQEEIASLKQALSVVSNGIQRDAVGVINLKNEVAQELKNAEVAHRVQQIAPSLQHEYIAPMEYFYRLTQSFEERIKVYSQELDELDQYLSTVSPLHEFTPQDLTNVLKKLNETFLSLAARLQVVHEAVKAQKDKYLQYRRIVFNDTSDVFSSRQRMAERNKGMATGPSPFSALAGPNAVAMAAALNTTTSTSQPSAFIGSFGGTQPQGSIFKSSTGSGLNRSLSFSGLSGSKTGFGQAGIGSSQSGFGAGSSLFSQTSVGAGSSLLGQTLFGPGTQSSFGATPFQAQPRFQLQKPPGSKRGKK